MSSQIPVPVAKTVDDVTSDWLSAVLQREVEIASIVPIGTGQMSGSFRVTFGEGETVVVKLAATDANSRATGVGLGAYRREISFYAHLADRATGAVPGCHLAVYDEDEGWFTLVLEDIVGAEQGDQIRGCTVEEARLALRTLARVHAPVMGDLHVGTLDFLNVPNPLTQQLAGALLPGFLERYGDRVAPEHAEVLERFVPVIDAWFADRRPPLGLVHGDYRLDNLLFAADRCTVVDWQTLQWGPALYDVSYFLAGAFDADVRRAHEEELVRLYHDELLAHGVRALSWELCWEEYRRQAFGGLLMTVVAAMVVEQTERGDEMFMTWLRRNAQQVLDLGSLDLLPEPGALTALVPDAADEGCHEPGPEATWSESWYFDAASADGTVGVYARIGRVVNGGHTHVIASIVREGRPAVMVAMPTGPLPPADDREQSVSADGVTLTQVCEEPLKRFRVTLDGRAAAFADHSGPLRGEPGEPVDVAFDLVWETDAVPYQWRGATRYEIPCRVTGTIRVDDTEIAFDGPGQRDHSWGSRDWFASDWMWSGFHLEDGTRTHAVGVPTIPGMGIGYVQRDGDVHELTGLQMSATFADDGLATGARLEHQADGPVVDVEPVGFGAVLFTADDGRRAEFPRALARLRTEDGRQGVGWIEWNRNTPA
ncbi:phosphotransferase [Conexibacter sp. W3-3-2]|uniref:DUF7064 domain-containing protein n=1 Tax=Conexibacter sp. W3-3-2 TaxID=2675227 RepID=UPI0012B6F044|nr:phosphotransferase [Conexibacter sp. W3-3-2]MTD44898.1 phosphotransferase [Conexibacter sp. W3-3-2]